jgi:hypothetical protein
MLSLQNCGIFKMANIVLRILLFTITYECEEGFFILLQIKGNHGNTLNMEGSLQYKQQAQFYRCFYYYGQKHFIDVFHIIILSFGLLLRKFMCISKANEGKPYLFFFVCIQNINAIVVMFAFGFHICLLAQGDITSCNLCLYLKDHIVIPSCIHCLHF